MPVIESYGSGIHDVQISIFDIDWGFFLSKREEIIKK